MELIARNFQCFPTDSLAYDKLGGLIAQIGEVRFPISMGQRNSNQFNYAVFDAHLRARLVACGATDSTLDLPRRTGYKYDFAFTFGGNRVVVEVEKANWEKILRDLLKFHIYLQNGADFGLLILPKAYPHSHGESENFKRGCKLYAECRDSGFGQKFYLERILLVGYEQVTVTGDPYTRAARNSFQAERQRML